MPVSIGTFMVTLRWFQDCNLVFKPMAVCVITNFSYICSLEGCMSVCFIIRLVSAFFFSEVIF